MLVLGIETSCDETAAAVVRDGREVLSSIVYSQIAKHRPYGGVVPEIACRIHVEALPGVLEEAVQTAEVDWSDIDRIAVTRGPGLASSLLVGVSAAKALSFRLGVPVVGVNHLEGHVASLFLSEGPDPERDCPILVLLVSGGHSCLVLMEGPGRYTLLGQTVDDAAGEALDKGAKMLGLGYPGGPEIERNAVGGNPKAVAFPHGRPRKSSRTGDMDPSFCFSFSGLKTALLTHLGGVVPAEEDLPDIAASYQQAVVEALVGATTRALDAIPDVKAFACVGGVARNKILRGALDELAERRDIPLYLAAPAYCTDNAAMIAGVAGSAGRSGAVEDPGDGRFEIKPSLPLGS